MRICPTLLLVCLTAALAHAQPRAQVLQPDFQFGQIWDDVPVRHEFVIKNIGDQPLHIAQIQTTCGCLATNPGPRTVPPGEQTTIEITLRADRMQGPISKRTNVICNDPTQQVVPLTMSGTVRQAFTLDPVFVNFPELNRDQPTVATFTLTNHLPEPLVISNITSTSPLVTATFKPIEPGKKVEFTVTVPPYTEIQPLNGLLSFSTGITIPGRDTYQVRYSGQPSPIVRVEPLRIDLGQIEDGKRYKHTFRVYSVEESTTFEIRSVSSSSWRSMPVIREIKPNSAYEVDLELVPPYTPGINRVFVDLTTTAPGAARLRLTLDGSLTPDVAFNPPVVTLSGMGDRVEPGVFVINAREPIQIHSVTPSDPTLKIEQVRTDGQKLWVYRLTMDKPPAQVLSDFKVTLKTSHPKFEELVVPVKVVTRAAAPGDGLPTIRPGAPPAPLVRNPPAPATQPATPPQP